ncbi:DUF5007 domain-containing protein [Chitinophaga pinensis]|uniref:DUF5007 domain-containing protein n=1 Tax=Chitinophaga pinensis (strain ATCC 43595 / DSM 2588 / LMG 13176 / NBRC 15968 / NCIMB 11800 / UQM 2034) TaxID=485918 RepID=A0A979G201_CHIPD|nr:DUF5007 domain-containing protein [Chitinophaga pinensis]ACU59276.1 hypothetical protein Cpin_1780 [Chitinophaga pinensis DSM 2588]
MRKSLLFLSLLLLLFACRKWAADDLDFLSKRAVYNQKVFAPILGRTTLYSQIFNTDNSTTPISFRILNVRYKRDGKAASDFDQQTDVLVWKSAYTGEEKSLAEIENKRAVERHSIFEIRPTSGDFVLWAEAIQSNMRHQPDSGYLFDVEATNSGGTNTYKDLSLMPMREQPYAPYEYDAVTGIHRANFPNPNDSSVFELIYNHPGVYNMVDDDTNLDLKGDSVRVFFNKKGNGNSLSFKFMDKDSLPIDPAKFNLTPWDSLMHGFDKKITTTEVTYQVAYPIPAMRFRTRYTNGDGSQAYVKFSFTRVAFGNIRQTGVLDLNFNIYQKGDWEIIFYFRNNPRFRDE